MQLGERFSRISKLGNAQARGNATLCTDRHGFLGTLGEVFNSERDTNNRGVRGGRSSGGHATSHSSSQHPPPCAGDETEAPRGQATRTHAGERRSSASHSRLSPGPGPAPPGTLPFKNNDFLYTLSEEDARRRPYTDKSDLLGGSVLPRPGSTCQNILSRTFAQFKWNHYRLRCGKYRPVVSICY